MLVSTPTKDYVSLRNMARDPSSSPSYRPRHCTPPKLFSDPASSYDSPMLTPSPLRQRPLLPNHFVLDNDTDDLFLQSPYKSPAPGRNFHQSYALKPQPIPVDDEEGSIFLASSSTFSPFFPTSSSQPLRTPVKQAYRPPSRSALANKHNNAVPCPSVDFGPSVTPNLASRVGVGTKRKSTAHAVSTPLRQHTLTPLKVTSAKKGEDSTSGGVMFDRLAPLAAPKFTVRTPQTKAETEVHLKKQTATLVKLKITDMNSSPESFNGMGNDSGCEMDDDEHGDAFFLRGSAQPKGKAVSLSRKSGRAALLKKIKDGEEVAEAISPGGHVTKRRARSRPVSAELLESGQRSPSPSPTKYTALPPPTASRPGKSGTVVFPSAHKSRKRTTSGSSSSETGSPLPRRRVNGASGNTSLYGSKNSQPITARQQLSRIESGSSATLFFGSAIPVSRTSTPGVRARINNSLSSSSRAAAEAAHQPFRTTVSNRHSYAGPGSVAGNINMPKWNTIQTRSMSPSPKSSPSGFPTYNTSMDDDEDMFFGAGPQDSSFMFSVTEGTPSPRGKKSETSALPRKYRPRDSGVMLSDDDDEPMLVGGSTSGDFLNVMPQASTSVNSLYSDGDDGLVTPGAGPELHSGWPEAVFVSGTDDNIRHSLHGLIGGEGSVDVDAFIMRTLAAAAKSSGDGLKKVPGTPVKKMKTSHLVSDRPWQSAVANKVGLGFEWEGKKSKAPRKSLPAAFPSQGGKTGMLPLDQGSDSEGEEDSPSGRREKYVGLGLGRPPAPLTKDGLHNTRTRWLMRRSSSGAFSSGSDSASIVGTPTRMKGKDWHLPMPRLPAQFSPLNNGSKLSPIRSTSNSSSGTVTSLNSPTKHGVAPRRSALRPSTPRPLSEPFSQKSPGRFENEFLEVDEVGSGHFGKVIKVRCKNGNDGEVFAVKKSKRFEGPKHRLRLREEVDILQHLSRAAGEQNHHPNVLAYVDSWEEDEALYIRTELCESGNLARFLWEYGRVFPRLDEARVWKIIVDLSNGLRFIHDAGVIHLDLKPANVFVTGDGRFKIGDFGMASLWPRGVQGGFEREGDKVYLAPEVLQGRYGKAADMFSFGMTMLETASNIVVPDQGEAWHRLRREDFSQVDLNDSPELLELIQQMMRTDPLLRTTVHAVCDHPIVSRARNIMERVYFAAKLNGTSVFAASPLASVPSGFLEEVLDRRRPESGAMDVSP